MTNQTNEEINVKGKHAPRTILITPRFTPEGNFNGYDHVSGPYLDDAERKYEVVLKDEHQDIVAEKDHQVLKLCELENLIVDRNKEITWYKQRWGKSREDVVALESKLARALSALEEIRSGLREKGPRVIADETLADISATPVLAEKVAEKKFVFGQEVEDA